MKRIVKNLDKLNDRVDETILEDEEKLNSDIQEIKEVLFKHKDLCCLSAPQIGIKSRIICIKFAGGDIRTFINPMIINSKGIHLSRESSPNIPDKEYIVLRNNDIEVTYQTPVGKVESNLFQGAVSEVFQQMINVLDGIMLSDFGLEVLDGWDEASQEDKNAIIDMYLDTLKVQSEQLKEEIDSNPDLKEIDNAINFMTSVAEGKTKIEHIKTPQEEQQEKYIINLIKKSESKNDFRNFVNRIR